MPFSTIALGGGKTVGFEVLSQFQIWLGLNLNLDLTSNSLSSNDTTTLLKASASAWLLGSGFLTERFECHFMKKLSQSIEAVFFIFHLSGNLIAFSDVNKKVVSPWFSHDNLFK